ncbi:hypothetical protein [Alkalibacterium sp. MB6]|uniref:hypothetical protein n=1 Tax=Alkalibacterium sp. MB6 TaxID=2081965 RepID=UPI00137B51F4|nr:hypothetical protein [Alkalibacterium sp. MB6]
MKCYKIKNDVNLFKVLPQYGYLYTGNYYRGDNWQKVIKGIFDKNPDNGIIIHGEWNNRRIKFKFPYRGTTESLDIKDFIPELFESGLVEVEGAEV